MLPKLTKNPKERLSLEEKGYLWGGTKFTDSRCPVHQSYYRNYSNVVYTLGAQAPPQIQTWKGVGEKDHA